MSFGFSVGDVITGANLSYRLLDALRNSRGASLEYQEAMHELGCIQQTFIRVGQMRAKMLPQATINGIACIVSSSIEIISKFLERTENHRRRLTGSGDASSAANSWRNIGWCLFGADELKQLRDVLRAKMADVNLLLSIAHQWVDHDLQGLRLIIRRSCNQHKIETPAAVAQFETASFDQKHDSNASQAGVSAVTTPNTLESRINDSVEHKLAKLEELILAHQNEQNAREKDAEARRAREERDKKAAAKKIREEAEANAQKKAEDAELEREIAIAKVTTAAKQATAALMKAEADKAKPQAPIRF